MNISYYLPKRFSLFLKINLRKLKDFKSGDYKRFSKSKSFKSDFDFKLELVQEIKQTNSFENKLTNIQLGVDALNGIIIHPKEIFSFWQLVPLPIAKNGFKSSRNLISGVLKEDFGGGLCQLSSIIYHQALISGMKIVERFNHSVDIYEEKDRFTPLGSDSTIVYGYKDLRFQNTFDFPIQINFEIKENQLICSFMSSMKINRQNIDFERIDDSNFIKVLTYNLNDSKRKLIAESFYKKP